MIVDGNGSVVFSETGVGVEVSVKREFLSVFGLGFGEFVDVSGRFEDGVSDRSWVLLLWFHLGLDFYCVFPMLKSL